MVKTVQDVQCGRKLMSGGGIRLFRHPFSGVESCQGSFRIVVFRADGNEGLVEDVTCQPKSAIETAQGEGFVKNTGSSTFQVRK